MPMHLTCKAGGGCYLSSQANSGKQSQWRKTRRSTMATLGRVSTEMETLKNCQPSKFCDPNNYCLNFRTGSMSLVRVGMSNGPQFKTHFCALVLLLRSSSSLAVHRVTYTFTTHPLHAAPMVRYSKLPARMLFGSYNTHITYTPMMVAREFVRSPKARDLEFSTNRHERGIFSFPSSTAKGDRRVRGALVAQFAARSGKEFADAVETMAPHVDGIDLNCGW